MDFTLVMVAFIMIAFAIAVASGILLFCRIRDVSEDIHEDDAESTLADDVHAL